MEVNELLTRLAPGQNGIIYQGPGNWRQVSCREVVGGSVMMLVHDDTGEGEITLDDVVAFKTRCDNGLLRVEGILKSSDSDRAGGPLQFKPSSDAKVINRRQAFRIESELSARMVGTACAAAPQKERHNYEWECVLRDLSVGGANAALPSPGPAPHSLATITFSLPTEDEPLTIECEVIEVTEEATNPPLPTMVRLMFTGLNSRVENQLGKYVNWVQLETRRQGLI